ncbi:hypothetical protein [Halanaerobium congolense]|jgi:hypothetical protein|nr:hypothetical protein [Halanaerobium congolense]TDP26842.1 hypothetical protein C8C79_10239 [Halanaerobium congolense]
MTNKQSANDQRANRKNPNNPAYKKGLDNEGVVNNPNNPAYYKSRK